MTQHCISNQLRIAGELVLVVLPGTAQLRLWCQRTGQICRECRVIKSGVCRLSGHDSTQRGRIFAVAADPGGSDDQSELLVDEPYVEETETALAGSPT